MAAGLGTAGLIAPEELRANEITVFKDRVRVDVLTSEPGIDFDQAWERRQSMSYKEKEFLVASREGLIASKRAAGRDVDLADVRALEVMDEG